MSEESTPATKRTSSQRLRSIDMLRGIAILWVIAFHMPHYAHGGWRENPWFFPALLAGYGYLGVPLFIVISGFCIHRAAATKYAETGDHGFDWGQFWKRRFVRLYPPYLAAIVLSLIVAFWVDSNLPHPKSFFGWDIGSHLLLVHNLTSEFALSLGNGAFWSLGTEEQLYALYFFLLLLLTRARTPVALLTVASVSVCWRVLTPFLPDSGLDLGVFRLGSWDRWPFHYWLHWALGALAVDAYLGNRKLPGWAASGACGVGFLLLGCLLNRIAFNVFAHSHPWVSATVLSNASALSILSNLGELVVLLGFFCLLNFSLGRESKAGLGGAVPLALAWVGRVSYSLYLVHVPVLHVLSHYVPLGDSPIEWLFRYLLYGSVVMAAGYLFHQGVERWFLRGHLPGFKSRPVPLASS